MKTKRGLFVSCFTALTLMASLAMGAQRDYRSNTITTTGPVRHTRSAAVTSNTTQGTTTTYRSRQAGARYYSGSRHYGGSGTSIIIGGGYGYPYYGYGYGYPYGYGYGYYPYSYGYDYPYGYNYGYYSSDRPGYAYGGNVVSRVQSRLARAGYYHGAIDGVMGPRTSHAIRAFERDHGLRVDGAISGPLLRNMGLRY